MVALSCGGLLLERGDLGELARGGVLTDGQRLGLRSGRRSSWLACMELNADIVVSCETNGARVAGDDGLADRGERVALVLPHDGVGDDLAGPARCGCCWRAWSARSAFDVAAHLLELDVDLVVALRGLLGRVVQPVDAVLDVLDGGLGLRRSRRGSVPDGRDERGAGDDGDEAFPAVEHERKDSLACRTPTR